MLLSNQGLIKWCSRTKIKEVYKLDIIDGFLQKINLVGSLQIKRTITDEDLHFGFYLYFVLTYCSVEDFKLFLFHKNLVDRKSMRTVLQAAKNNINSRNVKNCENQ